MDNNQIIMALKAAVDGLADIPQVETTGQQRKAHRLCLELLRQAESEGLMEGDSNCG